MNYTIDYHTASYDLRNKKSGKTSMKKSSRNNSMKGSRMNSFKKSAMWIPRVRHNYVPVRPRFYTLPVTTVAPPSPKSIPFVCGQSISKTHNIGLKIQETLNCIKQEKTKNHSLHKNHRVPRVYTHNAAHISNMSNINSNINSSSNIINNNASINSQPVEGIPKNARTKSTSLNKRKPVDQSLLKAVFLDLYHELTKLMEDLQELKNNPRNLDSLKITDSLELAIKKKELQISVMMALYKELMCLRKALGIKPEKPFKTNHHSFLKDNPRSNIKEFQSGDH